MPHYTFPDRTFQDSRIIEDVTILIDDKYYKLSKIELRSEPSIGEYSMCIKL